MDQESTLLTLFLQLLFKSNFIMFLQLYFIFQLLKFSFKNKYFSGLEVEDQEGKHSRQGQIGNHLLALWLWRSTDVAKKKELWPMPLRRFPFSMALPISKSLSSLLIKRS